MGRNATDVDAEHAREELLAGLDHARRLADEGRVREALAICVRLKAVAPTHPELLGLLGTLYARNGRLGPALAHLAEALLHAQRDSRLLWELAQVYLQAGAPVHALHSLRSYRAERRQIPVLHDLPDPEELITQLAAFMHAEAGVAALPAEAQDRAMMAAERGRLRLLFNDDPEKAVSDLREAMRIAPRYPQPRNNLSLALFYSGQPAAAIEMLETTLRDVAPDNVYALATLAFIRWAEGASPDTQLPQVQRAASHLHPTSRLLDRTRVAEVAGTLGAHELALSVLPDPAALVDAAVELGTGRAELDAGRRLRATALANRGDAEAALALLRESPGWTADPLTRRLLTALDQGETLPASVGGGYPYLGWTDLLSGHYLRRLLAGPPAGRLHFRAPVPPPPDEIGARVVRAYPRLPLACAILIWMGEPLLERLAVTLLALVQTPAADALLDAHLRGTAGSYSGRQDAGYALLDSSVLPNGTTVPFWTGTAWGEIRLFRLSPQHRRRADLQHTAEGLLQRLATSPEP